MAILGSTSEVDDRQEWSGSSTNNQIAMSLTFPAGGPWRVTKIGLWLAGKDGSASIRGVVWSSDRNTVLGTTAAFTAASRAYAIGANDNYERNISTPFVVNGGTTVYAGFWRSTADNSQWGHAETKTVYKDSGASSPEPMSGESSSVDGPIGVYLFYEAENAAPGAPTNVKIDSKSSGSAVLGSDTSYLLTFSGNDPGDVMASYDYQIDTTTGNGVVPDWAGLVADVTGRTNGISGQSVSSTITHSLTRGQWYALRVRTKDDGGLTGSWSSVYYFKVNSLPTVATRNPLASDFARIHNLATDLTAWTSGGAHAKPRFTWVYNDAESQQSAAFRVRIYNASSGTEGDASQVHDSGEVASVMAAGSTMTYDADFAIIAGTERWWTVKCKDSLGEWGTESARTAFKMRFGQAIYEFNPGATSSAWQWANGLVSNGYSGFFFATASGTGGAGRSAWVAGSPGALNPLAHSPGDTWLNVMVRLAPNADGTNVTLPSMTFTYIGGATTPDRWTVAGGASIVLDASVRRYGSQSLKVTTAAATSYIYPYTYPAGAQADIPVVGNVRYTWSLYLKTLAALTTGVRLAVYQAGTATYLLDGVTGLNVVGGLVTDTSGDVEGWRRLTLTFTVPAGVSSIRPVIEYAGSTAGQGFWIDAAELEEGAVASHWRPGLVGDAFVADANGLMIDGYAGGIMRLRGTAGGGRDKVELGVNGLLFGGDTPLLSAATGALSGPTVLDLTTAGTIVGKPPVQTVYGTSGSPHTWTKPAGLVALLVEVLGGGGGGGGCIGSATSGHYAHAGGGGGGGYARKLFAASALPASCTATVGAAGTAGPAGNNPGGTGGASSFAGSGITTAQGNGGGGGGGGADSTGIPSISAATAGAGGTATGGDINIAGSDAVRGIIASTARVVTGAGGAGAVLGRGHAPVMRSTAGQNTGAGGTAYGGGGDGALSLETAGNVLGGVGADGVVIVTEFYGP